MSHQPHKSFFSSHPLPNMHSQPRKLPDGGSEDLGRPELPSFMKTQGSLDRNFSELLRYIHCGISDSGRSTVQDLRRLPAVESASLLNIGVAAWDWKLPDVSSEAHEMKVIDRLKKLCIQRDMDVRLGTYPRKNNKSLVQASRFGHLTDPLWFRLKAGISFMSLPFSGPSSMSTVHFRNRPFQSPAMQQALRRISRQVWRITPNVKRYIAVPVLTFVSL